MLVSRIARRLSDRFRFVFACLDSVGELGRELERDGHVVRVLGRGPGIDLACARRLARFLEDERVGVVHAHQYTPFLQAMLARLPFGGRPILFTEHGRHHPDVPSWKRSFVNRRLLGRRDRIVGVGDAVRRALVANEGLPESRVGVVHNGINLAPFLRSREGDRMDVRDELGIGPNDFVAMQVARLDPVKDHTTAIRAIVELRRRIPRARLVIVGDGPEREAIESLVHEMGASFVHRLGMRRDVPRLLAAADACLLTSVTEGIPLCLVEAMAAGLPVVATDVGGVSEVVEHETSGLLAAAGDVDAIASQLVRLAADPKLRSILGENGRTDAISRFSESAMIDAYARMYEELAT